MRRSNLLILASAFLAAFSGCRSNSDLVEAELRTRNEDLRNARAELAKASFINDSLAREVAALRQQGPIKISPEQAAVTTNLKEIILTRQTGGYDTDHKPGDDALFVAIEPKDGDGHVIKAPGAVQVTAQEVSKEGLKTTLSVWDVSSEEVRRSWKEGFFSKGYQLILPWKNWPSSEHLRVIVRFYLADGRAFEADRDVTVRLPPPALRNNLPPSLLLDLPQQSAIMSPPVALPMPRTSESNKPRAEDLPWWKQTQPAAAPMVEEVHWRPKTKPSLADSVELGKPQPINTPPYPQYQP